MKHRGIRMEQNPVGLEQRIREFALELLRDFGQIQGLRKRVCAIIKSALPKQTGGRPALDEVTQAIALQREGYSWSAIYSRVIADYAELDSERRQFRQRQLRDRVRNRLYWHRKQTKTVEKAAA